MDPFLPLRRALETASESHEELADAREEVLVQREAIRSRAKSVRAQRVRAGDAEASFMNQLREFFAENGPSLPPALVAAYQRVAEERDALGSIEADYLQIEEDHGAREWELTEKENDFYQYGLQELFSDDLLDSLYHNGGPQPRTPPPPPQAVAPPSASRYQEAVAEHDRLLREFDALRPEQAQILDRQKAQNGKHGDFWGDPQDSAFVSKYSDLLTKIADCEVRIQRLRDDLMQHEVLPRPTNRRNSDHVQPARAMLPLEPISRSFSDSALAHLMESTSVTHRIRAWLLDYLKGSALEKTRYLNILKHTLRAPDIPRRDFPFWEDCATHHWDSDITEKAPHSENSLHVSTHFPSKRPGPRQPSGRSVDSGTYATQPDKHTVKAEPDFGVPPNYAPLSPMASVEKHDTETRPIELPLVVVRMPAAEPPPEQSHNQNLEQSSVVNPLNDEPNTPPENNGLDTVSPGDSRSEEASRPDQVAGQRNLNLPEAPFPPRRDSCQASEVEGSQRANTTCPEVHECSCSGPNDASAVPSEAGGQADIVVEGLDPPPTIPLRAVDFSRMLLVAPLKMQPLKCSHSPERPHSVSGRATPPRDSKSASLPVPAQPKHKRTKSMPIPLYLYKGAIPQEGAFNPKHTLQAH